MAVAKLEYFYFDACPFCQMVDRTINELKIEVNYRNILEDEANLERLVKDTGRRTVPCLYVDNKPMHESAQIIYWLKENADQLPKKS